MWFLCNVILKKSDCESAAIRCQHSSTGISCKTERFFFSVRTHSSVVCQCDSPLSGRREKTVETSLALAILIAFSRIYLYVHYPTDIFGGVIFGSLSAWIGYRCSKMFNIFQVERPWDLARDSGQRSWHIPIRITAHPRGAFISVGDLTPTETNLLLLTTWRGGSLLDWDKTRWIRWKKRHLCLFSFFYGHMPC